MQMPSENNPLSMEYQTMSNIPAELKYVASHEWLRLEEDGTITVGITHHAQELPITRKSCWATSCLSSCQKSAQTWLPKSKPVWLSL